MIQKHRIHTNIGEDQYIKFEVKQDFDLLELLSLKLSQRDVYTSLCADYGVVCGRLTVNNGFGVPNARVSIFVPLDDDDVNDPVISALYPYTEVSVKDDNHYRYNLLPARRQHSGHAATGTFPDQTDILDREEVLEVYEKYYKYTVKTNSAGDFMIWGVPLGEQIIVCDVDLSDISCFSLRPDDYLRKGFGLEEFKSAYEFKASVDIDSLPQIKTFRKTIEVYPFWGSEDLCEIGITRTDFDLSDQGVKIEPKAYLIGGTYTDGRAGVKANCSIKRDSNKKCDLTTKAGKIEMIRFTAEYDSNNRPILEVYDVKEDITDDGSFIVSLPMNMDFVYTNEFGENEYSNDPNKGIPTSGCYRFRFTTQQQGTAQILVPNIREYTTRIDMSYAWSNNYKDYPPEALSLILNTVDGFYVPQDYFYRFTYNKVFTVSSFHNSYFKNSLSTLSGQLLGLKEIAPPRESDCENSIVTPPVNFGFRNYTIKLLIADVLLFFEQLATVSGFIFNNTIAKIFHRFSDATNFWPIKSVSRALRRYAYGIQDGGQRELFLIDYPSCLECNKDNEYGTVGGLGNAIDYCEVGTVTIQGSSTESPRTVTASNFVFSNPDPTGICSGATVPSDLTNFLNNQTNYILTTSSNGVLLTGTTIFTSGATITFNDTSGLFNETITYTAIIRDKNASSVEATTTDILEEGCAIYDTPYDESLVQKYYVAPNRTEKTPAQYTAGMDVQATLISDVDGSNKPLPTIYDGETYTPRTPSGQSEFTNGIFYMIPGTMSNRRVVNIMKEYRRRRRMSKLFCSGVVNYSFVDNWLSGSLYFFTFETQKRFLFWSKSACCEQLIRRTVQTNLETNQSESHYYYRSTPYNNSTGVWGVSFNGSRKRINRPTTIVDLGPRDEFIREICVDPNLDPNCSVSREIGPTSYKDFGEILGMAINYRMDVSNANFDLRNFFDNNGFYNNGIRSAFDGDLLQLISINNEVGIEQFDLQSPKYIGYSYQILDPELYPDVFKRNGVWGPLPITMEFSEDGERVRACLNEPTHIANDGVTQIQGRLTESSQPVPFFLWDKKGTGFGAYNTETLDDQSWDISNVQVQPLQGMTYAYNVTGTTDDSSDKYLLLPITYDFTGTSVSTLNVVDDEGFAYDAVISGITGNEYHQYDSQYPGYTVLQVTSGTLDNPSSGTLYTRYGNAGTWNGIPWTTSTDFFIRRTQDYYSGTKQILSTPFMFHFGLKPGKTGLDKFIDRFGPKGAFKSTDLT